jgi:glycosyltransferase involved in cell wall biosynthesis
VRIAHVTDCYLPRLGGIERQVHGLACAQYQQGHDVEIITSVPANNRLAGESFPVHRPARGASTAASGLGAPIRYRAALSGRRTVLGGRFDVVHVHASTFSPLAYLVARSCAGRVPTALTLHSLWSYATPIFTAADAVLGWRRWPLAWSAVSSIAADGLARLVGVGRVSVLPNAVSIEWWRATARRATDPARVVVISTMRLCSRKRPIQLLRMMRKVRAAVPSTIQIELRIIGDGPLMVQLRDFIDDHHMGGWVSLLGAMSAQQIKEQYADADLYVSPSNLESFGIAALEARSAGLPVIAFEQTGTADFISHGREGWLVASDQEMVEAIAGLSTATHLRAAIAERTSWMAPAQSWPAVTAAAEALYVRATALTGPSSRRHLVSV